MTKLYWIEAGSTLFPDTADALSEPNGLLAAGGDMSVTQLLAAYRRGIFPWFDESQPVLWWSPDPRLVLLPGKLHVSKSMAKLLRQNRFQVTSDRNFDAVVAACAEPRPGQPGTWISPQIAAAYGELHKLGHAHSVEVWQDQQLVGGLYGVAIGQVFFGESMFSRTSNASKYGFIWLTRQLQKLHFKLVDCQVYTSHLASLGAEEIPRRIFEQYLINYGDPVATGGRWIDSLPPANLEQQGEQPDRR
ncbi:MAG: leucyl/phenylalanyl-tRNA--protein transferase [Gammaproteobacteria bacterium]|nr:leucyl/phenylalanyl-tRNA--protein transferase [Gammaproteobacteria bacterium]